METRSIPTPSPGSAAYQPEPVRPAPHTPSRKLGARRRRPAVLAMAVALIAAGGLGGAVLYNSSGQRIAVLALARDVPMGQQLTADDLVVARIAGDPALHPLDARDLARTVGLRATTDLFSGAMLTRADVSSDPIMKPGLQVVGVAAKRSQLPAAKLQPGLRIQIVYTPTDNRSDQATLPRTPETMTGTVSTVGKADTDGVQVIDVVVGQADAARLAVWVAGEKFQVLLAPRGGTGGGS